MKAIIIMGSTSDQKHADKITTVLDDLGVGHEVHAASAHKNPEKVLEIIRSVKKDDAVVFVTIAGRSNALSGFVAANCNKPTLGCPPFKDKVDMSINIHSTLQMPSKTPVLTVLDPGNCAIAVHRILNLGSM
ncbi:MAG: AIR carboxylase family protein [Flammeovirgaceae bacterium TMED290]|nr:MAG: AIR carboxylase family protein [Flammeovirgaceae bacterium TMED290]|tara:strand:- start:120 stop:515 length:396 start_codon:yes stop_codon:yes gene_type:complete